jgi:pyrroline-5-carboxylate reductase
MPPSVKVFFIGAGNMGGAILRALLEEDYPVGSVFFYEPNDKLANEIAEKSKAKRVPSLSEGFAEADITFLCVKPQIFSEISATLCDIQANSKKELIVVSIMAGVSLATLRKVFPNKNIVRTMPNIAVTVKKGTIAIATDGVEEEALQMVEFLFSKCAHTVRVLESQMDAVTGLSGSGPAFVFQFIEALAMGGIKMGLQKEAAMKLALSTLNGSIEMLEKLKLSPSELTANVCSPAGTTIAGIQELENKAFKGIVMSAVEAAAKRSVELGKLIMDSEK